MNYKEKMIKKSVIEKRDFVQLYKEKSSYDEEPVVDNSVNSGVCNRTIILDLTCEKLIRE